MRSDGFMFGTRGSFLRVRLSLMFGGREVAMISWFLMSKPSVSAKIRRSVICWMPLGWWVMWMKIGLELNCSLGFCLLIPVMRLWASTKVGLISCHFQPRCCRRSASRKVMCA